MKNFKIVDLNCMVCGKDFKGPEPLMCCSGRECGCMGMPVDPIVCSDACYHALPHMHTLTAEKADAAYKEASMKWIREFGPMSMSAAPAMVRVKPDIGEVISINEIEIPRSMFPEQYDTIFKTLHEVLSITRTLYTVVNKGGIPLDPQEFL